MSNKLIDINQHTNVLAYYIIRCELSQQLPIFLEYCRKYNKNYISIAVGCTGGKHRSVYIAEKLGEKR